eukprot:4225081-Pyramimonas_sp.AAC.1
MALARSTISLPFSCAARRSAATSKMPLSKSFRMTKNLAANLDCRASLQTVSRRTGEHHMQR